MNIKIIKEKIWYSANIVDFWIFTQWETFEELTYNLKEALELHYDDNQTKKQFQFNEFNLVIN
jgi:predicted RNase H-like HicB family nuclease